MLLPLHVQVRAAAIAFACCCLVCVLFTQQGSATMTTLQQHMWSSVSDVTQDNAVLRHHHSRLVIY